MSIPLLHAVLISHTTVCSRLFSIYEEADNRWKATVIELVDMREVITTYRAGFKKEKMFAELNAISNKVS